MKFEDWIKVGDLSFRLRKNGITIPLTDIAIASTAMDNNLMLVTRDRHFQQIPGLSLMEL